MKKLSIGLFLALTFTAPVALADVPPPDAEGCFDLVAGDACKTDAKKDGGCVKETCSRATESGSEKYDCLICKEGAQPNKGGCATTAGSAGPLGLAGIAAAIAAIGTVTRRRARRTTK